MANYYFPGQTDAALAFAAAPTNEAARSGESKQFGTFGGRPALPRGPVLRRRMNLVAVIVALSLPWVLFACIFTALSLSLHHEHPVVTGLVVLLGLLIVLLLGTMAMRVSLKGEGGEGRREPTWYIFVFFTAALAWLLAVVLGQLNYSHNTKAHYDVINLNLYPSVDPSTASGQQLMDAGSIVFLDTARIDLSRSMSFRNVDTYCVAPVTLNDDNSTFAQLGSYDFWAVGVNCCSGGFLDFKCGEVGNPRAHAGLRLMQDDQRAFFRLAVQQAEAAYSIEAPHPIFLHWMQDPIAEANSYKQEAVRFLMVGVFSHLAFQAFLAMSAVLVFSKMGGM